MSDAFRALPKLDLHCHLDGTVRPATALELGAKVERAEQLRVSPTCGSLKEFLDVFEAIYPCLRSAKAVERIAYELVEDCAADGIRYVEARFAPELQAAPGFSTDQVVEAALKGLARGKKAFGVESRVIVCMLREHSLAQNRRALDTALHFKGRGVVALDLAGDEAAIPMGPCAALFEEAIAKGLRTTCHAGETGAGDLDLVFQLGIGRIGHGAKLVERPDLVALAAERKVPVELNLTSNLFTKAARSYAAHPARRLFDAGVPVSLNTDDRAIMGITLTHEYEAALQAGFSAAELRALAAGAVEQAFLSDAERAPLRELFQEARA